MAKKVLIVDDEIDVLRLLENRLRGSGYEVISALDGKTCLKKAASENPDLIILDVIMPKMDGFQVCQRLKKSNKTKDIPVLLLTAKSMLDDMEKGISMGANDYVVKPYNWDSLHAKIQKFI